MQVLTRGSYYPHPATTDAELPDDAVWIDLLNPTPQDERRVEEFLGIDIPTREEMREIEESSRLYRHEDALYLTVRVLTGVTEKRPRTRAVTFVLAPHCLVTVRYIDPHAFRHFGTRLTDDHANPPTSGAEVFVLLLEAIVDRTADALEELEAQLEHISDMVFREDEPDERPDAPPADVPKGGAAEGLPSSVDLQRLLKKLGRYSALGARLRESLLSMARLLPFLCGSHAKLDKALRERLETLERDVKSLTEFDGHAAAEIAFLVDSTLGLINLEQNAIIKVFTVAATLLLPPTIVGSIYGMNFEHMPELHWKLGYPFALVLMGLSSAVPYWYFKRRGWF